MPAQELRHQAPTLYGTSRRLDHRPGRDRPRRGRLHGTIVVLIMAVMLAMPAFAGDLGFFESRRIHRQADEALARGDHEKAAELFHQLADGLDRTHKRRGEALFGAALARLHTGEHDIATELLTEMLQVFPNHESKAGAQAMRALLEDRAGQPAAPEAEPARAEPAKDSGRAGVQRLERLESRIASLEGQLREAREELQKKEEAIEKLKELVVGEGS